MLSTSVGSNRHCAHHSPAKTLLNSPYLAYSLVPRSFAQLAVPKEELEASPLGPLLDALPIIGRALAKRLLVGDNGLYETKSKTVKVQSSVIGGLFVWSDQLSALHGDTNAVVEAFTTWLWSGNGFSSERYAKLGLERPKPPEDWLESKSSLTEQKQRVMEGTAHGLEALRTFEGRDEAHQLGAIANPKAYQNPARKSAPSKLVSSGSASTPQGNLFCAPPKAMQMFDSSSFGNPTVVSVHNS